MITPWNDVEAAVPLVPSVEAPSPFAAGTAGGTAVAGLQLAHESAEQASVRQAVAAGTSDVNQLTNLVFDARHPERGGRALTKGEPGFAALAAEWTEIRDTVVRPLLAPAAAPATGLWVPGAERVANSKSAGGTYLDSPWRFVFHTIEGEPSAAAFRTLAATHANPPHLWAMPTADLLLQTVPLDRSAYALARPGSIQTNRLHAVQVECWGFAAKMGSVSADILAWLADRLLAPVSKMVPINLDRVSPRGPGEPCYGKTSPCRMSAADWQAFDGVTGHRNVPDNDHWDPGQLDLAAIAARAKGGAGSYIRREDYADHDGPGFEAERDEGTPGPPAAETPWSETPVGETPWSETPVGETPWSETPVGETPWSETPVGETPWSETPNGETPWSETPNGETPWSETPVGKTPWSEVVPVLAGRGPATGVDAWAALARALLSTSQEAGETPPLALLGETPVDKARSVLRAQASRWGTDEAAVMAALKALSPAQMAEVVADRSMIDILLSELSNKDRAAAAAELVRGRVGGMARPALAEILAAAGRHGLGTVAAAIGRDVLLEHQDAVARTGTGTLHGSKCTAPKPAGAASSDCTVYVVDVLKRAFAAKGSASTWTAILAAAVTSSGGKLKGTELMKTLQVKLGWEALFWSPDPRNPSKPDPETSFAYKLVREQQAYYGIKVDPQRSVINYRRTSTTDTADLTGIQRLRKLQFGVFTAAGGMHMALVINGSVYEVHWSSPATDRDAITATPLESYTTYRSGAIAAPSGDLALAARMP